MGADLLWRSEILAAEESLANQEHIGKDKDADKGRGFNPAGFADVRISLIGYGSILGNTVAPEDQTERQHDQDHRPKGVVDQQVPAVNLQGIHHDVLITRVRGAGERSRDRGEHHAKEAETGCQGEGQITSVQELLFGVLIPGDPVKHQEAQHREGELQDNQGHGDCPELIVHRGVVVEQLGEPHEVVAECQEDGQDRRRQDPPFLLPFIEEQTQQEKENRYRSHVHRSGSEGLGTPIERQRLGHLPNISLSGVFEQFDDLRFLGVDRSGR